MSLVSLNDYKEFAKISQSNPDEDEKLQRIADETESELKEFLNRDLETASYTEKYDGDGGHKLVLRQFPITSVTTLEVYDGLASDNSETWDTWVQGTDYDRLVIDEDEATIYLDNALFPEGEKNIRVTYVAGYTATTSGAEKLPSGYNVPKEISRTAKRLFFLNYQEQEGRRDLGLSSVGVGAEKTTAIDLDARDKILKRAEKFKALNV